MVGGAGAFGADGGCGHGFDAGGGVIPTAGSVLGGDNDAGDHTVIAGRGVKAKEIQALSWPVVGCDGM